LDRPWHQNLAVHQWEFREPHSWPGVELKVAPCYMEQFKYKY
jgi:hypothetical protein